MAASLATAFAAVSCSGDGKWTEIPGRQYNLVVQKRGATLGYSPSSGVTLLFRDGYAFKDLNRNGEDIDLEKLMILALLHDYGNLDGDDKRAFHALSGYRAMMAFGYPVVAKVCLTHSFLSRTFNPENYAYPREDVEQVKVLLGDAPFDMYDRIIQISVFAVKGFMPVSMENHAAAIVRKFSLPEKAEQQLLADARALKAYFDGKCRCDIYDVWKFRC